MENISPLQHVRVLPIENRSGQILRNALTDSFPEQSSPLLYELKITLTESIDDFGLRRDTTATFARMTVTAHYQLLSLDSNAKNALLTEGSARAISSYNILASTFAALSAEEDARVRASKELAEDIKLRLAAYFAK